VGHLPGGRALHADKGGAPADQLAAEVRGALGRLGGTTTGSGRAHPTTPPLLAPPPRSFLINLLACPALFFGTTLPLWIASKWRARKAQRAAAPGSPGASPAKPPRGKLTPANGSPLASNPAWDSALAEPLLGPSDVADGADASGPVDVERATAALEPSAPPAPPGSLPEVAPAAEEPPADAQRGPEGAGVGWKAQARVLLLTTFFLTSLFLAQVFSLLFTTVGRWRGVCFLMGWWWRGRKGLGKSAGMPAGSSCVNCGPRVGSMPPRTPVHTAALRPPPCRPTCRKWSSCWPRSSSP
jgi:hypothetical protein